MKIAISGGTGLIGSALAPRLLLRGPLLVLTRNPEAVRSGTPLEWHPPQPGAWEDEVAGADVIINLAGENVGAGRWTASRKKKLVSSRVEATRLLVDLIRAQRKSDRTFIGASAIGYYGDRPGQTLDESSPPGDGFLSDLTREWESLAHEAEDAARVVIFRFGIVLSGKGGALAKMVTPFKLFAGGVMGDGHQTMSWIDIDDIAGLIEWAIDNRSVRGTYNATAPAPVTNIEFTRTLGAVLKRPAILPAPRFALQAILGEMAGSLLLASQHVVPRRALDGGYRFRYQTVEESLRHQLR